MLVAKLLYVLLGATAQAQDPMDLPKPMSPTQGLWQAGEKDREAEGLTFACRWAAPEAVLAKVRRLVEAKQTAQARTCLDEALRERPNDTALSEARRRLAPSIKRPVATIEAAAPQAHEAAAKEAKKESKEHEEHEEHGEHEEPEEGAEAEPPYRVGLGYVHSARGKDDKLVDGQLQGAHRWEHGSATAVLHVLKKSSVEVKEEEAAEPAAAGELNLLTPSSETIKEHDTLLDTALSQSWGEHRLGLLLGYSFAKGTVSYKSELGLRYEYQLPDEASIGAQVRRLKYADGSALAYALLGSLHLAKPITLGAQLDALTGHYRGSALTLRLGYEGRGFELLGFVSNGHGIPSHPYLRPKGTEPYTTFGAEAEAEVAADWVLTLGAERRREKEAKDPEVELSIRLAWQPR